MTSNSADSAASHPEAAPPATNCPEAASADERPVGALEWQAPTLIRIDEHTTIPSLLQARVRRSAARPLLARKQEIGEAWHTITAQEFYDDVRSIAAGLIGMGLQPGARVAIMSRTRYEWTLLDFACWTAALVPVPIYETSSAEQIAYVLADAEARLAVTESITTAELVRAAAASLEQTGMEVLSLDTGALHTISEAGRDVPREQVEARADSLTTASIATIVYTSGTTGSPKGTVLSHGNFTDLCSNAHLWMPEIGMGRDSRLLLFLPLAHVFARFLEVFQISGEGIMGHVPDTKNLLSDLASFRPSYLLVVPRVLEKIYNSADARAGNGGARRIFRWAAKVAVDYSRALDTPAGPSHRLRAQRAAADRLVYRRIRALVGDNADWIISGGAPLSPRLAHFYRGLGIPVLEGYGLTETVGPIAVNTPRLSKIGTVGPPLPPMAVRISADGEILLRGPSVFQGYHRDPAATAAAFTEDGWFRTGDLGSLDRDGYVTITGRAKDVIVTAGGKNVSPAPLEDALRGHPLISQVVVVGEQRPFVSALITLDAEMLPSWLRMHGLEPMPVAEAAAHPQVLAALNRAVQRANRHVSRAESIREIRVLTVDFTEANGLLTPSLKVRRSVALQRFAADVDAIYGGPAGVRS
ncbi:AMP-dependent synthetase/ligase [Actinomyces ruminicola]|uniref:Acyl-CoA synthetase n=1 Tax=Actinomyces ruminicola TaxID=332524 RepID=A0A1G9ZHY2_9ACTO|nr:AMP-dependent synthetase/ligase [Actinomyces ruminicola]SDM52349.1 long-chain acyl-CoA synthetase [Actinomyces ruminicola]SDN20113.1 long-chain acyl-CoA synthetase [Actinomyces ruminicola]